MDTLKNIEPQEIWTNFSLINSIPRASKKEQAISDFMVSFGQKLGLQTTRDEALNILIKKPATKNCTHLKKVVLQAHVDMVHQKEHGSDFNFEKQGIDMFVDKDWVKAKDTTLGADNGLGVATIMAVLESKTIEHPEIEALFTVDEETGMTGAFALKPGFISGDILLNLDTEEDNEITIGCAGGVDFTAHKKYTPKAIPNNKQLYKIALNGLKGGHSGVDIHKGLGNANVLLIRTLHQLNTLTEYQLIELQGGNLRNAIPRDAHAIIAIDHFETFSLLFNKVTETIQKEYNTKEPDFNISIHKMDLTNQYGVAKAEQLNIICVLHSCFNGVYSMDSNIKDLVATSNNLSSVLLKNGAIEVCCLTRSSIESEKDDLVSKLDSIFKLGDFDVITDGDYPGWQPNPNASIITTMVNTYTNLFKEKPIVNACHAGLECGIIGKPYPNMEMVSFGPTIRGAHSPNERASISSTQKFWTFLKEILKNIPAKEQV